MFEDLKEIMPKELNESMRMMSHQVGNINKEIENTKKNQTEIQRLMRTITETKNSPEGINNRTEQAESRITELEDRSINIIQSEEKKEKRMKKN